MMRTITRARRSRNLKRCDPLAHQLPDSALVLVTRVLARQVSGYGLRHYLPGPGVSTRGQEGRHELDERTESVTCCRSRLLGLQRS